MRKFNFGKYEALMENAKDAKRDDLYNITIIDSQSRESKHKCNYLFKSEAYEEILEFFETSF